MATIKSYSDLQQSKKLAEILPLESADMVYDGYMDELTNEINYIIDLVSNWKSSYPDKNIFEDWNDTFIPCWSLAALLGVLPKVINNETLFIETSAALWHIGYRNVYTARTDNPVDACYEMILMLHELNLL